jgi:4'-phosphopantetheinyl transferase
MTPSLHDGDVHTWTGHVESRLAEVPQLRSLLSNDERDRADGFRFERHRRAFVIARAALREVLASYVHLNPQDVSFVYGEHGKPALASSELQFNASHSGDRIVVAVTRAAAGRRRHRTAPAARVPRAVGTVFSEREIDVVRAAGADDLAPTFFRCWTRKEAYVKARGQGLSLHGDYTTALVVERPVTELRRFEWRSGSGGSSLASV